MALRVLLADESATIKKVFQLALQDFAVDVTAVSLGPDVMNVARQFKPDIIFCDVLLQKKSGYEVCAELKADAQLKSLPVVLMWSGFMELDEDKMQAAKADGTLEKPFDVQALRQLVNKLVPRTQSQRLGQYLNFPQMPEMVENKRPTPASAPPPMATKPPVASEETQEEVTNANWNMESFDPIPQPPTITAESDEGLEGFEEVQLPARPQVDEIADLDADDDQEATQWSAASLNKFQVSPAPDDQIAVHITEEPEEFGKPDVIIDMENEVGDVELELESNEPTNVNFQPPPQAPTKTPPAAGATASPAALSELQVERIIREQAKGLIEQIAWKVVPDLAQQIIERELKRLLAEKSP